MTYSFDTILLSAAKTGINPPLVGTSLSGVAVTVLSASDTLSRSIVLNVLGGTSIGVAFNPIIITLTTADQLSTFDINTLSAATVTIGDSQINVPSLFHLNPIALIVDTARNYSVFTFLSSYSGDTVPLSSIETTSFVSTPESRRLHYLGYF